MALRTSHKRVRTAVALLLALLLGLALGAAGLALALTRSDALRAYLLTLPMAHGPQRPVEAFVEAIIRGDEAAAIALWEVPSERDDLAERRRQVIEALHAAGIAPRNMVLHVEWWRTCCEPGVTCDPRNAGGARLRVQFLDGEGKPLLYTFDVFTRRQPYWGAAEGYPSRDWVIRDVYPEGEPPLFWPLVYEGTVHQVTATSAEP